MLILRMLLRVFFVICGMPGCWRRSEIGLASLGLMWMVARIIVVVLELEIAIEPCTPFSVNGWIYYKYRTVSRRL